MRLGLTQTTVEVEIKEEKEIDEEGEIDAAVGVTNKAIRLFKLTFTPLLTADGTLTSCITALTQNWITGAQAVFGR
jgi:hypothetical protein